MEYQPEAFIRRVEERRRLLKFKSERALCIAAGLNADAIRQIRKGRARALNGDNLLKLATTLQVSTDWLLRGGTASPQRPKRKRA